MPPHPCPIDTHARHHAWLRSDPKAAEKEVKEEVKEEDEKEVKEEDESKKDETITKERTV